MVRSGYTAARATAVVAAATGMGMLIPPCLNMVVLGALLARRPGVASMAAVESALERAVSARHRELNDVNRKALKKGYEAAG